MTIDIQRATEMQTWVKSTCAYCGVGCGIEARCDTAGKVEVRGDKTHPANYGRLCSKGLALGETAVAEGRLLHPQVGGTESSWDDALETVAKRIAEAREEYGPESIGFYVSGQLLTEDYYVANKLMKGFIGSANIDTNSRLCMSSSVAGHVRAFGADTVPGCYEDLELADLVVLVGSNLAWCHPVLYQRLKAAKETRPQMKVVVIDPRRTDTCDIADLHLALQPGTDVALFNGLLGYLAKENVLDQEYIDSYTDGFLPALVTAMEDGGNLQTLAATVNVPRHDLETLYAWFAATPKTVTVYSQGVNQSSQGTDKVNSIINCHLATGRIGKPGCGPFSVTGQPNAMGGREVGGLANTLAAHMNFDTDADIERVARFWQADSIARKPGLKAVDLFDAVASGQIKVLWIMATNPVVSMPDGHKIQRALEQCPTVIVSDCIADTATTRCADILLPAAGWAEKSGTVTNSERRISRQRALMPTSGEARPDWWIVTQVARRLGFGDAFPYRNERDVFVEHAALTAMDNSGKRDLDLGAWCALSVQEYDDLAPRQWPIITTDAHASDSDSEPHRFFAKGGFFTASGKGNFVPTPWRPPVAPLSDSYPLILNTGRIRDQWHTMTRTSLASRLNAHLPEPFLSVHPQDAHRYRLTANGLADVTSAHGRARLRVAVTRDVTVGQVFMPMHWSEVFTGEATAGRLLASHVDPVSGQPELKHTPVAVAPWDYASEALVIVRGNLADQAKALEHCGYWTRQPIAGGAAYYVASQQSTQELHAKLQALMPQSGEFEQLNFSHAGTGEFRSALGHGQQVVFASIVSPSLAGRDLQWLTSVLDEKLDAAVRQALIKGEATGALSAGKIVCSCRQVGYKTICDAIHSQGLANAEQVGNATGAGTGCGSCIAEVNSILSEFSSLATPA